MRQPLATRGSLSTKLIKMNNSVPLWNQPHFKCTETTAEEERKKGFAPSPPSCLESGLGLELRLPLCNKEARGTGRKTGPGESTGPGPAQHDSAVCLHRDLRRHRWAGLPGTGQPLISAADSESEFSRPRGLPSASSAESREWEAVGTVEGSARRTPGRGKSSGL